MTYKDYMINHTNENLSWCKPYVSNDGKKFLIMANGEAITIRVEMWTFDKTGSAFPHALHALAKQVNPSYNLYEGYDDTYIALDAMKETGCANCPFLSSCEAMNETLDLA